MYNFIIFWHSSFLLFSLCPNYCPLVFSEGRRQHFDRHHCVRAGWSHWLGHHCYGDQGRGRSFPKEGHWEEVSEHTHTHARTCMNTCADYGIQRDYRDHAPWEQTHHPLCKYCFPLLARPSPCTEFDCTTARQYSQPHPRLDLCERLDLKTNTVWTIRNALKIIYQLFAYLAFEELVSVKGLLEKVSHYRLFQTWVNVADQ